MNIIITSPSLDATENVSGMSSVANFIINGNKTHKYIHFTLGKRDKETRNLAWLFRILYAYINWGWILLSKSSTVIHFNLALDSRALIRDSPLILTARLFHKPMIVHIHGGEMLMDTGPPIWANVLLKLSLSGNNPKIVSSPREKEALRAKISADNVVVLPNCIALHEAENYEPKYLDNGFPIILFLGRISKSKGLEDIHRALASLQERGNKFIFVMAGSGPDETQYVTKFHSLLGEKFEFKKVVSGYHKTQLLKYCNIFLLPSLFEGLPITLLEAMSFGLVPVVTNVGSIGHVVANGKNGLIVNTHSPDEIVSAIETLMKGTHHMEQLSRNARRHIFSHFNPQIYFERLNALYQYEQHNYIP
jgi:glycosyltransferase involved in cell wall biosynthesis